MPRSLLSNTHTVSQERLAVADEALARWSAAWPQGHSDARILEEYLVGRSAGDLDISGRAVDSPAREAAETAEVAADPSGSRHASDSPSGTAAPTLVVDDPDGSLSLVVALAGAGRTAVVTDSAAAGEACRAARESLPEPVRSTVGVHRTVAEAAAALVGDRPAEGATAGSVGLRVVVHAPKQVALLRECLRMVEALATEVVVVGREKHMSRTLNRLLAEAYGRVDVSPGRAKSRLLVASAPKKRAPLPVSAAALTRPRVPVQSAAASPAPGVPEILVSAYAGTFGAAAADPGSRLLVRAFAQRRSTLFAGGTDRMRVLDLGSGNGWLLAAVGALLPGSVLFGIDDSQAAVESTALTAASVRPGEEPAVVAHVDATRPLPWVTGEGRSTDFAAGTFDLVTVNPPFHEGTTMTTDSAHALIDTAVDLLAPGGRLVVVHNSHLRYRAHLQHRLVEVEQWARDRRFTVVSGVSPGSARGETRTPTS